MTCENTNSEPRYKVIVKAIVGGPFDLRKDDMVTETEVNGWKDEFLRLEAIEPLDDPDHPAES